MKLLWFHFMAYTDLPDDFKQKHPSVWVDIDPKFFDPAKPQGCTTTSSTSSPSAPTAAGGRPNSSSVSCTEPSTLRLAHTPN